MCEFQNKYLNCCKLLMFYFCKKSVVYNFMTVFVIKKINKNSLSISIQKPVMVEVHYKLGMNLMRLDYLFNDPLYVNSSDSVNTFFTLID